MDEKNGGGKSNDDDDRAFLVACIAFQSSPSLWQLIREDCDDIVESNPAPPLKWGPQKFWKEALRAYTIASEAEKRMDDMLFFVSATAYSWSEKEGDSKRDNADIR